MFPRKNCKRLFADVCCSDLQPLGVNGDVTILASKLLNGRKAEHHGKDVSHVLLLLLIDLWNFISLIQTGFKHDLEDF